MVSRMKNMALAVTLICSGTNTTLAQDTQNTHSDWQISLGAGARVAPNYEGSDEYAASPVPLINIKWKDRVSLGYDGLMGDVIKQENYKAGVGLTYHFGRDEDGGTFLVNSNDDSLQGMGDIDGALGLRLYGSYDFAAVTLKGGVTRYLGDDNNGLIIDAALSKRYALSKQLYVTPSVAATWADKDYNDTFFGVSSTQAAQSQFSRYTADAGFKDVSANVNAYYAIDYNWFVTGNIKLKQLVGEASDSPISEDNTSISAMSAIGYKF